MSLRTLSNLIQFGLARREFARTSFVELVNRSSPLNKIKLILFTKKNCTLCDEAKEFIEEHYPGRFQIEEVDITKDRQLFRKFKLDIPVFYYNDKLLMQHKADRIKLDALLKTAEQF